ncbi:hypothetical protein QUF63_05200 [Anaerolineales bacterium HSG25]|nr:hypothetical protein [Anaerolineales bacterium HSG25]
MTSKPQTILEQTFSIRPHLPAVLILLAFIGLGIIYSIATPPFEAGDESRHYAVVKYMADTTRLPIQDGGEAAHHWEHEGSQPPLYYALAALTTAWIETGSWDDVFWYNPHTSIGDPLRPDNKHITIHPPNESWSGHVLAVHLIRFMSILFASVTVAVCYLIALTLFQGNRWLATGAMAVTAFNPMFIFISSAVNNDNAVIMFVTLALWVMIGMGDAPHVTPPRTTNGRTRRKTHLGGASHLERGVTITSIVGLGVLIGLGALSKLYALGLLPLAGLWFIWLAYRDEKVNQGNWQNQAFLFDEYSPPSQPPPTRGRGAASPPLPPFGDVGGIEGGLISTVSWAILKKAIGWGLILGATVFVVAGWFYLRNAWVYNGDLLGLESMRKTADPRPTALSLAVLWAEFEGLRIAYWALFGGVNILVTNWIYRLLDFLSLLAFVGLVGFWIGDFRLAILDFRFWILDFRLVSPSRKFQTYGKVGHVHRPTFYLLLGWCLIMVAGFIVWNLTQPATQGRLFYPAISAISALMILGLTWLIDQVISTKQHLPELPTGVREKLYTSQEIKTAIIVICTTALFIFALSVPFIYIIHVYAKPNILTEADLPAEIQPLDYIYDDTMQLLGYHLPIDTIRPAEKLRLTLYWQLLKPTKQNYSQFIHVLGRQREKVAQRDTYPGGGHWPTSYLKAGDILADEYEITIPPHTEMTHAPTRLTILAGIYDYHETGRPGKPVVNQDGQPIEPIITSLKLIPWTWPKLPATNKEPINFLDQVTLLDYQLAPMSQTLTLVWQVQQPIANDYTIFIQAWPQEADGSVDPANSTMLTGFDGPPVNGDYPTSLWNAGEVIVDQHELDLDSLGDEPFTLLVGLYNPATGERLPAFDSQGVLNHYAVEIVGF